MTSIVLDRPLAENASYAPEAARPSRQIAEFTATADVSVMTDIARIVAGCREHRAECFSELVDVYAGRCYGFFYRLTTDRDLSDELLSRLFLKLVVKIGSYRGGSFDSWLFKIASNIFYDHLRKKRRRKQLREIYRGEIESKITRTKMSNSEVIDKLQVQLNKLDEDTREVIMLRFYSGLSFREIGELRGEPTGTITCRLHRGLRKLREQMSAQSDGDSRNLN